MDIEIVSKTLRKTQNKATHQDVDITSGSRMQCVHMCMRQRNHMNHSTSSTCWQNACQTLHFPFNGWDNSFPASISLLMLTFLFFRSLSLKSGEQQSVVHSFRHRVKINERSRSSHININKPIIVFQMQTTHICIYMRHFKSRSTTTAAATTTIKLVLLRSTLCACCREQFDNTRPCLVPNVALSKIT